MNYGVLLEMWTVAEEADKDIFCGDMEVETTGHGETDQTCSRISIKSPDMFSLKEMRSGGGREDTYRCHKQLSSLSAQQIPERDC